MNKFVIGALALGAGPAFAGTSDEWLGLDQEINSLSATTTLQGGGVDIGALIRSSYATYDDEISATYQLGGPDEGDAGWAFQDVDVWLEGQIGDFDWRVSMDLSGNGSEGGLYFLANEVGFGYSESLGSLADAQQTYGFVIGQSFGQGDWHLQDAYGEFHINPNVHLRWGQFMFPLALSNQADSGELLMINRTILGGWFHGYDLGAMIHGDYNQFGWAIGIQNGTDGIMDEYRFSLRAEFRGNGGAAGTVGEFRQEGALGTAPALAYTVGFGWTDDDGYGGSSSVDSSIFVIDAAATYQNWSGHVEYADFDDDWASPDGSNPFSFTLGYLFNPAWEAAFRYEDLDEFEIEKIGAGINWYLPDHTAKWQLNISSLEVGDDDDGTIIELGLTLGASTN